MTLEFQSYWKEPLKAVLAELNDFTDGGKWDFLKVSYSPRLRNDGSCKLPTRLIAPHREFMSWGAIAYVVSSRGASNVVSKFSKGIGWDIHRFRKIGADVLLFNLFRTYTYAFPYFVWPDENDSTIHQHHLDTHRVMKACMRKIWALSLNGTQNTTT